jgi:ATP-dependent Clp protease protease subunit
MAIKRVFASAKKGSVLEVLIYDVVGYDWYGDGITVANLSTQIKAAGDFESFCIRINSPGGDVFEGVAIANLLRAQGKPIAVHIDGVAASIASVIAMAGDTICMGQGSMMMIHNAWTYTAGSAAELRKTADTLDKISGSLAETYVTRTGKTLEVIQALMDAETWLSAEECVAEGFATEVVSRAEEDRNEALALAAAFSRQFAKAPRFEAATPEPEQVPAPPEAPPIDWEGQLAVRRKQLDLAGL